MLYSPEKSQQERCKYVELFWKGNLCELHNSEKYKNSLYSKSNRFKSRVPSLKSDPEKYWKIYGIISAAMKWYFQWSDILNEVILSMKWYFQNNYIQSVCLIFLLVWFFRCHMTAYAKTYLEQHIRFCIHPNIRNQNGYHFVNWK